MATITKILTGTGALVALYLLISSKNTASVVSSIGNLYSSSVKTLQGRG